MPKTKNKCLQLFNLQALLPTPTQPAAAGGDAAGGDGGGAGGVGEKEKFGEATEFINWEGRGAADLILPRI